MKSVFLDTGYLIAPEAADDQHHQAGRAHRSRFSAALPPLATKSYVFDEVATFFTSRGHHAKAVEIGRPESFADSVFAHYRQHIYHQPTDRLRDDHLFGGIVQQTRVAFRLGHRLANSSARPEWNPGEAFVEARRAAELKAGRR